MNDGSARLVQSVARCRQKMPKESAIVAATRIVATVATFGPIRSVNEAAKKRTTSGECQRPKVDQ